VSGEERSRELQLRELARHVIADYRAGRASLDSLVDGLNSIWESLEPSEWREEFRGYWWILEQVYAVALDRGKLDKLSEDDFHHIEEALEGLESLLESTQGTSHDDFP